ncbi:MAG: hypothetical protein QF570_20055 [Myxococcota bacterium]|jgi:hypothetical protein|nr:hypothetical protein [Myxococcota bacterium]
MKTEAARALCRTYLAYHRLGGEVIEGPACRTVRCDTAPLIYDVNRGDGLRADVPRLGLVAQNPRVGDSVVSDRLG